MTKTDYSSDRIEMSRNDHSLDLRLNFDDDVLVFESRFDDSSREEHILQRMKELGFYATSEPAQTPIKPLTERINPISRQPEAILIPESSSSFNIYSACKAGDIDRVRYLVEIKDIDINRKDIFDSIPLFYACLCGHIEIVKYLLDRGTRLDASTFEGARCYYGALNDEIRKVLRCYQAKPSQLDELSENYHKIFILNPSVPFYDLEFMIEGLPIRLHKFILMHQCPYFMAKLSAPQWIGRNRMRFVDEKVRYEAMVILIRYFYTDNLQVPVFGRDIVNLLYILKKLKMFSLQKVVLDRWDYLSRRKIAQVIIKPTGRSMKLAKAFQDAFDNCLRCTVSRNIPIATPDFKIIYKQQVFHVHRIVLWSRSVFFQKLLSGNFQESKQFGSFGPLADMAIPEYHADLPGNVPSKVLEKVLQFMYTLDIPLVNEVMLSDRQKQVQWDLWHSVLGVSELYLMEDLKVLCFRRLCQSICMDNLWQSISLGMHHASQRIIDSAVDFIRYNARRVYVSEDFRQLMENPHHLELIDEINALLETEMDVLFDHMKNLYHRYHSK